MVGTKLSHPLQQQINDLEGLLSEISKQSDVVGKCDLLANYLHSKFNAQSFRSLEALPLESQERFVLLSLAALGQCEEILQFCVKPLEHTEKFNDLLHTLISIDQFYAPLGGIIGYHVNFLKLLREQSAQPSRLSETTRYRHPVGLDLRVQSSEINQAVRWGIESLPQIAEIYPIGGAGDRLNLIDDHSQQPLPAALLQFGGQTLIEGLINDLSAREYLYFKIFQLQVTTPIVLMTSEEKENHSYVLRIFEDQQWFNRGSKNFFFIEQPLVPLITEEGKWAINEEMKLILKPGGHGVLWKLAEDKKAFDWLAALNRLRVIVRQINNPIAGTDVNLLALAGVGCKERRAFGFISCERLLGSPEGMNVVVENENLGNYDYCLTNIEYTDFNQKGIEDIPAEKGSPYSLYPSNTNILFADISAIREKIRNNPFPGQLINLKNKITTKNALSQHIEVTAGRLESTMQNIADEFVTRTNRRLENHELGSCLRTFIIYNDRKKTISTTKKSFTSEAQSEGTPEKAMYDLLNNTRTVLSACDFDLPVIQDFHHYLHEGPNLIFRYHPALGPLYSIISQKIRGGKIEQNSEWQMNVSEVDVQGLYLKGSLKITADFPLGSISDNRLMFSHGNSCILKNVHIINRGIDFSARNVFWKNRIYRHECLEIHLGEKAEFVAENITLMGDLRFIVPAYHRMRVSKTSSGNLQVDLEQINDPTWYWKYEFNEFNGVRLTKIS